VARNILLLNKGEQTKKLVYSRSGQILSLDKKCISLLGGMTLAESFCEQRINISALKKKAHAIPAHYDNNITSEISMPLNFINCATTRTVNNSKMKFVRWN
jgi:hypothetical protein